jgi:hypothetical protein
MKSTQRVTWPDNPVTWPDNPVAAFVSSRPVSAPSNPHHARARDVGRGGSGLSR